MMQGGVKIEEEEQSQADENVVDDETDHEESSDCSSHGNQHSVCEEFLVR